MSDYREAVILALVGISILSIPAASGEVMINSEQDEGLVKKITSGMGDMFRFESSEARRELTLQSQNSELTSISTPEDKVLKLQNSKGELRSYKSANKSYDVIETPYGDLKVGYINGRRVEKFEGNNRSKVEKIKQELTRILEEKKQTLNRKAENVVESNTVQIRIEEEFDIPGINITNKDNESVNLQNWKLVSKQSADAHTGRYIFNNVSIEPGEEIVLGTRELEDKGGVDIRTSHIRLYDNGDRINLVDEWGNSVTKYSYSGD
jgi:hypothetical protein